MDLVTNSWEKSIKKKYIIPAKITGSEKNL